MLNNKNKISFKADPRELYEAINLKYALDYAITNVEEKLNITFIERINQLINKNIKDINGMRKVQVYIRGAQHIPPSPELVPTLLGELIYRKGKQRSENIFDYVARFHIEFEHIHPFEDGNGRTGRVLITKELLKRGYAPVVIPSEERDMYLNCLADRDIKKLSKALEKLNRIEVERMAKFGLKL